MLQRNQNTELVTFAGEILEFRKWNLTQGKTGHEGQILEAKVHINKNLGQKAAYKVVKEQSNKRIVSQLVKRPGSAVQNYLGKYVGILFKN